MANQPKLLSIVGKKMYPTNAWNSRWLERCFMSHPFHEIDSLFLNREMKSQRRFFLSWGNRVSKMGKILLDLDGQSLAMCLLMLKVPDASCIA